MTPSEKYVYELSRSSFLTLWSYPNPQGKKDKELCDILIFCEPHIIIVSVKEITPTESGDFNTDFNRWKRTALDKSFNQIYGAERYLNIIDQLKLGDGKNGIKLPPKEERKYYRIAIVIGGEKNMPLLWGDMGKGFIHVFDSISTEILITELDTISDFVKYLGMKEDFYLQGNFNNLILNGGEEDLLAYYLGNSEKFESENSLTILEDGLWEEYKISEANKKWIEDVKDSYVWDQLIETLSHDFKNDKMEVSTDFSDFELIMRTMAKEKRYYRILLSKEFLDFYNKPNIRSRPVSSYSGIIYVFMVANRDMPREERRAELFGRCLIVRRHTPESNTIIGIATERNDGKKGFSLDVCYFDKPKLSNNEKKIADNLMEKFGWFKNSIKNS